ncbi:MAG TPA: rhodanese-like domain-containing protein [Verrucomicrobiae bacterium]|jgi:rhodanese-related sulfurtransferase|nr:rhodanese-like domain-containing protein [Verrucomicrobiae bacterium]
MGQIIARDEVQRMTAEGAALIEVLPQKEYERVHLPGAVNLPLADLYPFSAPLADKDRRIVLYCYDFQ